MTTVPVSQAQRRRAVRTWLGRGLGVLLGLLLAFALIETAGRVASGFDPLPEWAQAFYSRVGYELRPNEEYIYASAAGEFEVTVRHNSRGLHDVEHTLMPDDGVFRVLIVSDSYAHAREVPLEANFARLLELALNDTAPANVTVEVINAGHFGLGTTQEYLYYRYEGQRYQPDLVLLGFYVGNDVIDNHAPLIRAWNGIDSVDFPYMTPDGTLVQPGMSLRRRLGSWLRQNLFLVNTLSGSGADVDRVEVGKPALDARTVGVPMGIYLPPDDVWTDGWQATDLVLAAFKTEAEANGARLGVFVIPDRRQIYDRDWDATLALLPTIERDALDRERPTRTILSLLDAQGIPALDLGDAFRATDTRLYFEIDGHFNASGHAVTANALADWLYKEQLLP